VNHQPRALCQACRSCPLHLSGRPCDVVIHGQLLQQPRSHPPPAAKHCPGQRFQVLGSKAWVLWVSCRGPMEQRSRSCPVAGSAFRWPEASGFGACGPVVSWSLSVVRLSGSCWARTGVIEGAHRVLGIPDNYQPATDNYYQRPVLPEALVAILIYYVRIMALPKGPMSRSSLVAAALWPICSAHMPEGGHPLDACRAFSDRIARKADRTCLHSCRTCDQSRSDMLPIPSDL
jgi:hypothetical protein